MFVYILVIHSVRQKTLTLCPTQSCKQGYFTWFEDYCAMNVNFPHA